MHPITIVATAHSTADAGSVFAVLKDAPNWPCWSMFDAVELNQPGNHEPYGVGSVRTFITKISRAQEKVTELIPDRRLAYVLLAGLPLRDYRAVVEVEPEQDGSRVTWSCSFYPKYPGTGWFWSVVMRHTLNTISAQLALAPTTLTSTAWQAA